MSIWMKDTLAALAALTSEEISSAGPVGKMEEGDKLVGVLDTDLQRPFALAHDYGKKFKQAHIDAVAAMEANNEKLGDEHLQRADMMKAQAEALASMAWISVKATYGLWSEPSLALLEDWKLVVRKQQPAYHLLSINLGDILGMRGRGG